MKKYRWKTAGLSLVVSLAVFASACNSETSTTKNEKDAKDGPLKLSVQMEGWGTNFPKNDEVQAHIEKVTNTDLDVTWVPYSDYEERFNIQLSSGDLPDVVITEMPEGQLFSSQVIQAIEAGVFKDLTPFIEDPEFDKKYPNLAGIDDEIWESLKYNGKIFAMPRYIQPIAGRSAVVIRKDLMEKSGLKEPTTMEELAVVFKTLHKDHGVYGFATPEKNLDSSTYKPLVNAFTGVQSWDVDDKGNFEYVAFMPEYKDFLLWMKDLFDAGAIDPELPLQQGGSSFSKGLSAAQIHDWWSWKQGPQETPFDEALRTENPDVRAWAFLPVKGPKGYMVSTRPFQRPALVNSSVTDEEIPQLLKLLDYTASEDYRKLTRFGIEGIHHKVENGKIVVDEEKFDGDAVGHWFVMFQNYVETTERIIAMAEDEGVNQEERDRMKQIDEIAYDAAMDMDLDNPQWSVNSPTYFKKWGSIVRDLNDNKINVIMGKMSIDQWDKYVKGIVESNDYKQILKEFKEGYKDSK
ncbi:extracellular solute-binding protein [Mesobacillus foraminis]|uniref:extracellular solute-binding protein n=1 Tax=Mesobacillus foraminis TaxID=279826 RepID=UPI001BE8D406|nr:extracellular solute-binding protein [Mesobacillus foraminis]MBT2757843.1 extracellular solute-binding protein [Mesobacillus foraminis]